MEKFDKEFIEALEALNISLEPFFERPATCTKPNCTCIDIAEYENGNKPVKSYACRAKVSDIEQLKSKPNGWIEPLQNIA